MGCGDSATYGQIQQNAPYQWANLPTADTSLYETVDYVVAKLNGKDAIWAGDAAAAHRASARSSSSARRRSRRHRVPPS